MKAEKCIESLIDEMLESQWSDDVIKQEYRRLTDSGRQDELKSVEDLEPISHFSDVELEDEEIRKSDFERQVENHLNGGQDVCLISQAEPNIPEEMRFSDEYIESLINEHLFEEKDFLDRVAREAVPDEGNFQDYIENHFQSIHEDRYYPDDCDDDFMFVEYPLEKDVFDDLGDTSYMDQGIFKGENTDSLEEPFCLEYHENPFSDDLFDSGAVGEYYPEPSESADAGLSHMPDDLIVKEPAEEPLDDLIKERLFEENILDMAFAEVFRMEKYWDDLINQICP
jgi:hypothetical protein